MTARTCRPDEGMGGFELSDRSGQVDRPGRPSDEDVLVEDVGEAFALSLTGGEAEEEAGLSSGGGVGHALRFTEGEGGAAPVRNSSAICPVFMLTLQRTASVLARR